MYLVTVCLFSCTALFVSIGQVIGCEDRFRNDLYCVRWGVKLYSPNQRHTTGRSPVYFHNIYLPFVYVPFRSRLRFADNDDIIVPRTRTVTVRYGPRSSALRHPRFGTCCHLISRILTLVMNSSSRDLRHGSLCKPTHKRCLCENFL